MRAFEVFNLPKLIPVVEQMQPDPEFPTVKFPNPEEGKSALVSVLNCSSSCLCWDIGGGGGIQEGVE